MQPNIRAVVIGGLHTDIFLEGARTTIKADRVSNAKSIRIAGGGKSPNIARMMAEFLPAESVVMVGRTTHDPFGLWKPTVDCLNRAKVVTEYIQISPFREKYPGVAVVTVYEDGSNASCLVRGANEDFSPTDIEAADSVFTKAAENEGLCIISMETPFETVIAATERARHYGLKIALEPGGMLDVQMIRDRLLRQGIYLIKPNEHEAGALTGIPVGDFASAKAAADVLQKDGVQNVLITAGKDGAFLFSEKLQRHIPTPTVTITTTVHNATGCGDQVLATVCAAILQGKDIADAARLGVSAGTLQFYKPDITPVTQQELDRFINA